MIVPNSNVYFADCETVDGIDMGVVKVGLSHKPEERVRMVTTTEPFICKLVCHTPGDMFLEYFCHMWLNNDHVAGEYFRRSDEVKRLIASIKDTGSLPFPIEFVEPEGFFIHLDVAGYMDRNGISFRDVEKATGITTQHYRKILAKKKCGNRRLLAAVSVAAVKKGLTVHWARDFKPVEENVREAA